MAKVFIYGVGGKGGGSDLPEVEKTVELAMAEGDQVIKSDKDTALKQVTVLKPTGLLPKNIVSGVDIGGVIGTANVSTDSPQLRKLTLTRSNDTMTITNPATNGNFVEKFRIYNSGVLLKEQTGTTFSLIGLGAGDYELQVSAVASGFYDSEASAAVKAKVFTIAQALTNLTTTNSATLISNGLEWTTTLKPTTGLYLPEDITVTMGGKPCVYKYNSYTGALTVSNVSGDIAVTAVAYTAKKLRRPTLKIDGSMLTVTPPRYAKTTNTYIDDELTWTYIDTSTWEVQEVEGAAHGFELNSNDYYESQCKKIANGYAVCKVVFTGEAERDITLRCISYGESNYDYGIISQVDKTLALSNTDDGATGSTNVLKNFKGLSSPNPVDLTITIPAGEHFIYCKYRKDGSGDTGNDSLQFMVVE